MTTIERFMAKVQKAITGCWEWTACCNQKGYGLFRLGSRKFGTRQFILAHRFAYRHFVGPIPDGLTLDHLCRNRACVNPEHLEPVLHRVNVLRGIGPSAQNARKMHCLRGHEYNAENTYTNSQGKRACRICKRSRRAAIRARRKSL
jgi:hypothetical protein